ncbi:MAG: hypothetical protein HDR32_06460 [Treponema sp.]|nr:hypothetical protein [Treponema sp.]
MGEGNPSTSEAGVSLSQTSQGKALLNEFCFAKLALSLPQHGLGLTALRTRRKALSCLTSFLRKLGKQRIALRHGESGNDGRFCGNCAGAKKTRRILAKITSSQTKRPAFSKKSHQDDQNAARFGGNRVGARKTPAKPHANWSENYKKKQYILYGV